MGTNALAAAAVWQELGLWHDLLDRAIASVALSKDDKLLAVGSANDVRNLLITVGSDTRKKWQTLTLSSSTILDKVAALGRAGSFWDVGKSYKDANISQRAHLKIHTRTRDDVTTTVLHTQAGIHKPSLNETNNKFTILPDIASVVLIVRDAEIRRPTRIYAGNSSGSETFSLRVDNMTHAFNDISARAQMPFFDKVFWNSCLARGLAMQIRWDFGITNSAEELETAVVPDMVVNMTCAERYMARKDVKLAYESQIKFDKSVVKFGDGFTTVIDIQAEVILRILDALSEVTMGIPGLSKQRAMLRRTIVSDFSVDTIMEAANILKSIKQHQEGGVVIRNRLQQAVAIGYVILASTFSILVGALDFAGRDNAFERVTDVATTATLLLVSVFGLVKLTSEDDNAIRNTLLGYKLLRNINDVERYYNRHRKERVPIQTALVAVNTPLHWLADSNTCYLQFRPLGSIAYTTGISARDMRQLGMLFGNKVTLDYRLNRSFLNSGNENAGVHMERKLVVTDLKSRMEAGGKDCTVAGAMQYRASKTGETTESCTQSKGSFGNRKKM